MADNMLMLHPDYGMYRNVHESDVFDIQGKGYDFFYGKENGGEPRPLNTPGVNHISRHNMDSVGSGKYKRRKPITSSRKSTTKRAVPARPKSRKRSKSNSRKVPKSRRR